MKPQQTPRQDQERTVGFEMEYAPTITTVQRVESGNEIVEDEDVDACVSHWVLAELREKTQWAYTGRFLGNGYAAYIDCDMVEVCTPESYPQHVGMLQLVSERLVSDALKNLTEARQTYYTRRKEDVSVRWLLPLRVQEDSPYTYGATSGFHENYCIFSPSELIQQKYEEICAFLGFYAMSQKVFSGQGMVDIEKGFRVAQKEEGSTRGVHEHAMIKTDPHFNRYELRAGNYPLTAWQLRYRAAYTSALLRYMESNNWDMRLLEHLHMQSTATSVQFPGIGEFSNQIGVLEYQHALDFQMRLHDMLAKPEHARLYTDIEAEAVAEVGNVLDYLRSGSFGNLLHIVPWVRKALVLAERVPDSMHMTRLSAKDRIRTYDRARTVAMTLEVLGTGSRLGAIRQKEPYAYSPEEITAAVASPPALEVAKRRAANIRGLHAKHCANGYVQYESSDSSKYLFGWMSAVMSPNRI